MPHFGGDAKTSAVKPNSGMGIRDYFAGAALRGYRASEEFSIKDLPKDYPYTNAYIVLVSKKHIKCITVAEILEGKDISPTSKNYLGNRKEFDLDKEIIIAFCDFAVKFFENV